MDRRCIHWENWKTVCLPVANGGLGLIRIEDFNAALISKWKWRILEESAIEKDLKEEVFNDRCCFEVGNGFSIPFWQASWLNHGKIKDMFPSLFSVSLLQDVSIAATGGWSGGTWRWGDLAIGPALLLNGSAAAAWQQLPASAVQSEDSVVAAMLQMSHQHPELSVWPINQFDVALVKVWKMGVPIKIKVFGWRIFSNILPTYDRLASRGMHPSSFSVCVFCENVEESSIHSFLLCGSSSLIWKELTMWIGLEEFSLNDFKESFLQWTTFCMSRKVKKDKERVIWLALWLTIWTVRNGIVFRGDTWNISDIVWEIKYLAWR
ncbi:uncharacterized protein LOC131651082 [Vicia villosa]|uniref:uncharacterized protein LOC131651082 n=1 Tax=Vicia villosa TaxID=3911 RepID=UPI00273AC166|nr:uncharacterized protein LOC131651082 [Vicia villosa]